MEYRKEIDEAIKKVLDSGQFILGNEGQAFEKEFAEYCGVKYAVGVANGTEALYIALKSADIGPGDEVITVSHTASATIAAIYMTGAKPVFVDIDERSMLMNPDLIAKAVTARTRAILPVHLYGRMCDMKKIMHIARTLNIHVIEDCAQSVGAGKLHGLAGCYSFYPTKNLGGIGDGGCLVMNDKTLAIKAKSMREYGYGVRFVSHYVGINSRLDEIQAAVLRVKLKHIDEEKKRRWELGNIYILNLHDTDLILPEPLGVVHQFVVRHKRRDELVKALNLQIHYPVPCHLQPAYADGSKLPVTEKVCQEIASLPMRVTPDEAHQVCYKIKEIL